MRTLLVSSVIFATVDLCAAAEPVVVFDADDGRCPAYRFAPLPR